MTVAQLIEELQKQAPGKPVKFLCECDGAFTEIVEIGAVANEGGYVLLDE